MISDSLKVTGTVHIQLFNRDGSLKQEQKISNLVVSTGKSFIASSMAASPTKMSHMAVGSIATAASVTDTALLSQLARQVLTSTSVTSNVVTYSASFPAGVGTGAVVEAGIFDAASAGNMLCRTVFAVVNKGIDDAMTITWLVTVS